MVVSTPGNPLGASISGDEIILTGQAQGNVQYFNGTKWVVLAPGVSGQFLKTLGAAANPIWDSQPAQTAEGSYTGDGALTQAITGMGFTPIALFIHSDADENIMFIKFKNPDNDFDFRLFAGNTNQQQAGDALEGIRTLDADGFSVGDGNSDASPNTDTQKYWFVAFG